MDVWEGSGRMNRVCLIGNLTRDPELRYTTGEKQTAMCRFSVAINDGYGENQRTSYPNIVAFGKTAELCDKYLRKGNKAGIEGRIQTGSYEKDGRTIYTTDIVADRVEFLTPKQEKQDARQSYEPATGFYETGDELPFE